MAREVLTAARTYYVRSDALYTDAPGRIDSPAGACKTWQQAFNFVQQLDFNNQVVTVQHGVEAGVKTFAASSSVSGLVGGGTLIISGSPTPGNTVFDTTGLNLGCFEVRSCVTLVQFNRLTVRGEGVGLIIPYDFSTVIIGDGVRFGAASSAHIWVHDNAAKAYLLSAHYEIIGGAAYHIFVNMGGCFLENSTVTLTGTPAFSGAFIEAVNGGAFQSPNASGNVFTGACTGARFFASTNGVINSFGGGPTYFPGSTVGATSSGGQYA